MPGIHSLGKTQHIHTKDKRMIPNERVNEQQGEEGG